MKVVFTFPLKESLREPLEKRFPQLEFVFSKEERALEDAAVIVTYGEDITEEKLQKASKLQWVMVASAGVEKMPIDWMKRHHIPMANVSGIHKTPMAEAILAHILAQARALPTILQQQREHYWNQKVRSTEIKGKEALIIGPGAIGQEVGRLLQAFGVRTVGCNYSGQPRPHMDETVSFRELSTQLPTADFIISVVPSTDDTRHLLTANHFEQMKRTVHFLNFGRGDLYKEEDLIEALRRETIGYATLDVYQTEPLHENHPYWTLPNCTVSPHVSSHSGKYLERAMPIIEENLTRWLDEKRPFYNEIDLNKQY